MKKINYKSIAKNVIDLEIAALKKLKGSLNKSFDQVNENIGDFINFSFDQEIFSENNKRPNNVDNYTVNKNVLFDDIKMMHEFIEFKYFKKVMKRNNNIIE